MFERIHLQTIKKRINESRKFIQVILGPRQVGKTTMMTQLLSQINSRPLKSAHLRNIVRKQYPADFFNKPQKSPHGSFEVVCGGS